MSKVAKRDRWTEELAKKVLTSNGINIAGKQIDNTQVGIYLLSARDYLCKKHGYVVA